MGAAACVAVPDKPVQPSPPSSLQRLSRGGTHGNLFETERDCWQKELPLCLWLTAQLCKGVINVAII